MVINPLEALDMMSQEEEKTAFLVNTMVFYRCPANLLEVYAARLKECTEKREVVFFLPLSISDYSAAGLRQILTSFRRQVIIFGSNCRYFEQKEYTFLTNRGPVEFFFVSALLRDYSLCWDRWKWYMTPTSCGVIRQ